MPLNYDNCFGKNHSLVASDKVSPHAGMLMDLISPLFPSAFVTILCVGSMARSVSKRNVDLK